MNRPSAVKCCPIFTATGMRTAARTRSTIDEERTAPAPRTVRSRSAGRLKRFSSRASAPAFSTSTANGAHSCDQVQLTLAITGIATERFASATSSAYSARRSAAHLVVVVVVGGQVEALRLRVLQHGLRVGGDLLLEERLEDHRPGARVLRFPHAGRRSR